MELLAWGIWCRLWVNNVRIELILGQPAVFENCFMSCVGKPSPTPTHTHMHTHELSSMHALESGQGTQKELMKENKQALFISRIILNILKILVFL